MFFFSPEGESKDTVDNNGDVAQGGSGPDSIEPMVPADGGNGDGKKAAAFRRQRSTHEDLRGKVLAASESQNSRRHDRIRKGADRLKPEARLTDMTLILKDDVWFRRNRSKVYAYLVPLMSLFYFIPSIQVRVENRVFYLLQLPAFFIFFSSCSW